ncbi:MAG: glutamine synthetase III [Bacteroidales bacterium]|nr:glutamine synthetase III [Bacteroidales bacterium]NLK81700.1 glutamine synthetase type III [Bacteroidales bacterium]HPY82079.1 glutamine synthetase III [Bacteroidales bacterium]
MNSLRFEALKGIMFERKPLCVEPPMAKTSDYYGCNVFNKQTMKKFLPKMAYEHILECIESGTKIDRKIADEIALGMKTWAIEKGCTHYTHWFHPLTDGTAEKHDAFIEHAGADSVVESFNGEQLSQAEPDASSFPSGGIRQTFEARGYTAWDPASPAFIINKTLCIPTIFVAYTGDSLDHKTVLLKSLQAVDKAAVAVCTEYFDAHVKKVTAYLGWEQEYFLIDEVLYSARPDLCLTGRTIMGHPSAKDQQLDDHYFSSIPERVSCFMKHLEIEAYKLGIPLKNRHNEVAPNQFECAAIYEECNLAVDHNQVLVDVMKRVAVHHGFQVLFHEKPFKGINGSGKHSNLSLATDTGVNLFKPGKTSKSNLQFLTFIVNTLVAVYDNQDLLRASIMSNSNEYRLGTNEAPPVIISAFLGKEVSTMLDQIESDVSDKVMTPEEKTKLKLDIGKIPEVILDSTDRNRTSPFAFTGNRFEFRAVGSQANCSVAMIALNTAIANQLTTFKQSVDELIEKGVKKDEAIFRVLRTLIKYSKAIRFDGDGYSDAWVVEAAKRGLTNVTLTPISLEAYLQPKTVEMFTRLGVMTKTELESRVEIRNEMYKKQIQIESRVLGDLALNHIIPTAIKYQTSLIENVKGIQTIMGDEYKTLAASEIKTIREISQHTEAIRTKVESMRIERAKANKISSIRESALVYGQKVKPALEDIREHIDRLETIVDNELWPLPKYREMLFL